MASKKRPTKKKKTTEPMPSLVFQNIQIKDKATPTEETTKKPFYIHQPTPARSGTKILLWAGVAIFTITITFLWGWAFKIRLDSFSWQNTPENKMLTTTKNNWDENFNQEKEKIDLEKNKDKIKEIINHILITAMPTSTFSNTTSTATTTKNNQ